MKEKLLAIIKELKQNINDIENIGWQPYKDSEDYEKADQVRMDAELNLEILKKAIEKYVE